MPPGTRVAGYTLPNDRLISCKRPEITYGPLLHWGRCQPKSPASPAFLGCIGRSGGSGSGVDACVPGSALGLKDPVESGRSHHRLHPIRRMHKYPERTSAESSHRILQRGHGPDAPARAGVAVGEDPPRLPQGDTQQALVLRITTDHPIHRDHIDDRQAVSRLAYLGVDELDPPRVTPALGLLDSRL